MVVKREAVRAGNNDLHAELMKTLSATPGGSVSTVSRSDIPLLMRVTSDRKSTGSEGLVGLGGSGAVPKSGASVLVLASPTSRLSGLVVLVRPGTVAVELLVIGLRVMPVGM